MQPTGNIQNVSENRKYISNARDLLSPKNKNKKKLKKKNGFITLLEVLNILGGERDPNFMNLFAGLLQSCLGGLHI